jgi:hypothetical protein
VIEVGGHTGTVEAIGLRVTKVRLLNGAQRVIPNGEITQFVNYSKGWGRAVLDVSVGYDTDVHRALATLGRIGVEWARRPGARAARGPGHHPLRRTVWAPLTVKVDAAHALPRGRLRRRVLEPSSAKARFPTRCLRSGADSP